MHVMPVPTATPDARPSGPPVIPSHADPIVRQASTLIGGPVGRHAAIGAHRFWTPLRVLLLLSIVTFGIGFAQKLPCHGGNYGEGNRHAYTLLCYTDVHALWFAEGLSDGKTPYVDHPVEYPVVIGGIMQVATLGADNATEFYDRTSILLLVSAMVMTGTSVGLAGRRRRWDAALVALAPGLALHGTTNWDLPAAAITGAGLYLWSRGRPGWSPVLGGAVLGIAIATKLYPVVFFVPLFFLCLRAGKLAQWAYAAVSAVAVAALLNVAGYFVANDFVYGEPNKSLFFFGDSDEPRNSIGRFFVLNQERGADWDSLWFMFQEVMQKVTGNGGWTFEVSRLNKLVAASFLIALAAIAVMILKAPRRPRVGQVLFLTVAAFLLTNKVNSPQYTIWLIPLAVMARPRWRAFLVWQGLELAVMFTRFYFFVHLSKPDRGLPVEVFLTAIALRDIALIVLMALVVREIFRPDLDVVRADGIDDDPAGGVLDHAPDAGPGRSRTPVDHAPDAGPGRSPIPVRRIAGGSVDVEPAGGRWQLGPSPALGARSIAVLAAGSALLAVVMSWPLVLHLRTDIPQDLGDPLLQAWQVGWGGHALRHQPLDFFQSNTFHPLPDSLAFSDALLGYAPIGALFGSGVASALTAYNVLFLFAYALAFAGAFLLARELGVSAVAAAVAGAAFAYAPFRLAQNGHLHVISSGGVPLALFLLLRGCRRRSPGLVVAGWLVAAWQVSIGFTIGLQLAYLLAGLVAVGALRWVVMGRPPLPRRLVLASAIGMVVFVGSGVLQARPYLRVQQAHPESVRTVDEVKFFSPPGGAFLAAPAESRIWGGRTKTEREALPWAPEQTLFPGLAVLVLAVAGLVRATYPVAVRVGLGVVALVTALFAMGLRFLDGRFTYRLLYDHAPGWQGVRTPSRIVTLTTLALALLAAGGVHRLAEVRRRGRHENLGPTWPVSTWMGVALTALVLLEGSGALPHPAAPVPPAGQGAIAGPQLHLPTDAGGDLRYMFWSTEGFPRIVNGTSGFTPGALDALRRDVAGFPDQPSVGRLRDLGVRSVVLHPDLAAGTAWADAAGKDVAGLRLDRVERGDVVVFSLR